MRGPPFPQLRRMARLASEAGEALLPGATDLPSLLDAVKGRPCGNWLPALPPSWQRAIYQSGERYSFSDIIRAYEPCRPGARTSPAQGPGLHACGDRLETLFPGSILAEYARTVDADSHRWRHVRKYSVPLLASIIARRHRQAANSTTAESESDPLAEPLRRARRVGHVFHPRGRTEPPSSTMRLIPTVAPAAGYAAIHLRLGDVLERSSTSVLGFLQRQHYSSGVGVAPDREYVRPLHYFRDAKLAPHGGPIYVLSSAHCVARTRGGVPKRRRCSASYNKSCTYLHALTESLRRWFPSRLVHQRLGYPPDDDLVFMASAAEFVPSGGGFSDLIASLVQHSGGRVVRPSSWPHAADGSNLYDGMFMRCPKGHRNAGEFLC